MKAFNRRDFLKYSTMAGLGSILLPSCVAGSDEHNKIGIQLYTLRDLMREDPKATLSKLGEIGYQEIEAAGYSDGKLYGMPPKDFKELVGNAGLRLVSGHYQTGKTSPDHKGTMTNNWEQAVEDAAEIEQEYMVLAYLHEGERQAIDDYHQLVELINEKAEICRKAGIQFIYHNHDFEFVPIDGEIPYDILLAQTDPDLVKMELDLYWTKKANVDPVQLFERHPGRFPLFHVKDMDSSGDFAAVGTGKVDFNRIFAESDTAGLKHLFVEQDQIKGDKWETVTTSYQNLQQMIRS